MLELKERINYALEGEDGAPMVETFWLIAGAFLVAVGLLFFARKIKAAFEKAGNKVEGVSNQTVDENDLDFSN